MEQTARKLAQPAGNGLAFSMEPDEPETRTKEEIREHNEMYMRKIRKENKWRRITKMLANNGDSFDILDAIDDYAEAYHEYEKAREKELRITN